MRCRTFFMVRRPNLFILLKFLMLRFKKPKILSINILILVRGCFAFVGIVKWNLVSLFQSRRKIANALIALDEKEIMI